MSYRLRFITAATLLLPAMLVGQFLGDSSLHSGGTSHQLLLSGNLAAGSHNFSIPFVIRKWSQNSWQQEDKRAIQRHTGGQARLGFQSRAVLGYQFSQDSLPRIWPNHRITIENSTAFGARLDGQLVDLLLFGNKAWAGRALDIQDNDAQFWQYQSLRYQGALRRGSWEFLGGLAFHLPQSLFRNRIDKARLRTTSSGSELSYSGDLLFQEYNRSPQNNAWGLSIDLGLGYHKAEHSAQVYLQDLGFFDISGGSQRKAEPWNAQFRGFPIDNIFDPQLDNAHLSDKLPPEKNQYQLISPFSLSGSYTWNPASQSWLLRGELRYRHLPGYSFQATGQMYWQANQVHFWYAETSVGGFQPWQLGGGYQLRRPGFRFHLALKNLLVAWDGLPGQGTALEAGIQISLGKDEQK